MMTRLLYVAIALVVLLIGWRLWSVHQAYGLAEQAPFGNSIGPEKAAVTVVEFMDYRCSACRVSHDSIRTLIEKHPDVRFVFRHFPVFGQPSVTEADLALAAGKQGKFREMHELLINRETPVTETETRAVVEGVGADYERLMKEWRGQDIGFHLLQTLDIAQTLGINSTPTFIVNRKIVGTKDSVPSVDMIDQAIAAARK